MFSTALIAAALYAIHPFTVQAEFNLVIEDIVCPIVDEEYFKDLDVYITDDEENEIVVNFTIVKSWPETAECHFTLLSSSMGDYNTPVGFDIQLPFCDSINEPVILGPVLELFGFTGDNCPPPPGVYGTEGYSPPKDRFPDTFPPNKYMALMDFTMDEKIILETKLFLTVS